MALKNGIYILELIPKDEGIGEGKLLYEFLHIIMPDRVDFHYISGVDDFFDKLNENRSNIVHISCHGHQDDDGFSIPTPDGTGIMPETFNERDRLTGRNVVITGCFLGRKGFADGFLKETNAKSLIAPVKLIDAFDVAMWCVNFYHHLIDTKLSFGECYDYMKDKFYVPGAMQMWERKE
jgi:hypothetical protein